MLKTRLWMGTLLAALTLGMLLLDGYFAPWYPFLFAFLSLAGQLACWELRGLFSGERRPSALLCHLGLQAIIVANWVWLFPNVYVIDAPALVLGLLALLLILAFLREIAIFQTPGDAVTRVALTMFVLVYLGVLASFLPHLRWRLFPDKQSILALIIAIFVPKCCDIGAYFTGRLAGAHRMTPLLSPKKTWEGAAGGLVLGVVVAVVVSLYGNHPPYYLIKAVALGVALSVMGMSGDLAESLLKREAQKKDASQVVPGFGGILDVVDSVLFAAPLSFAWLTTTRLSPLG